MKIALLSDLHIDADPSQVAHGQNMADNLRRTVEEVIAEAPDAVFVTGDIAYQYGEPAAYQTAEQLLEPIRAAGITLLQLVGNHDNAEHMHQPSDQLERISDYDVDFIVTNTQTELKAVRGKLGGHQLEFLESHAAADDTPIVILGHHNPEFPRKDFKDKIGIEDTDEFVALLDYSPNIKKF